MKIRKLPDGMVALDWTDEADGTFVVLTERRWNVLVAWVLAASKRRA